MNPTLPLLGAALVLATGCSHSGTGQAEHADPGVSLGYRSVSNGSLVALRGTPMAGFPGLPHRHEVEVINLWAVWCGPCKAEAPILRAAASQLASEKVAFISVNANDSESKASSFATAHDFTWPQLYDQNGSMLLAQHFTGQPNTLILNRSGDLTGVFTGPISNPDALIKAVHQAQQT